MNKVCLTGNLCKDNVAKIIKETNRKKIENSIAVKRNYKNANGEYDSDFINIVVYGQSADYMEQYLKKGDKVAVTGRWQKRHYTNKSGTEVYVDECIVDGIELISKPQQKQQEQQVDPFFTTADLEEDLPF